MAERSPYGLVVFAVDGGCMDGRARWYRLRMCRPASYHQHSRSASFDAGGGGGGGAKTDVHGDGQDDGVDDGGASGRRRTTSSGHTTTRAPSSGGRAATALHRTTDVILLLVFSWLTKSLPIRLVYGRGLENQTGRYFKIQ